MEHTNRRIWGIAIAAGGGLLIVVYICWAMLRPLPEPIVTTTPIGAIPAQRSIKLAWPGKGEAAFGLASGGVVAQSRTAEKPLPTASVAKIMTALSVLQKHPLNLGEQGPTLTLTAKDVASYEKYKKIDGSVAKVAAGEEISEYQALQALLLPSANNMAETLARWSFGSIDDYTTYANAAATQLGMTHSKFTDPSGFAPSTVSTPSDLVVLGQEALHNPVIAQIVNQKTAEIPVAGEIRNVNWLLGQNGVGGIKTGNSDEAGGCFLFAATHHVRDHDVTFVGAILGDSDLQAVLNDTVPLLASARDNVELVTPVHSGQVVGSYSTVWGAKAKVVAAGDISFVRWKGAAITSKIALLETPAGTDAGSVTTDLNGADKGVDAKLQHPLARASWTWRLAHPL